MKRRLKVLVSAYACNPYKGSEEGVGWGWVKASSKKHDIHVITALFHRPDIERACTEDPDIQSHVKFYYVSPKPWHYSPGKCWSFIENSFLKIIMNYAYRLWQRDAFELGRKLHYQIHFDLVHQVTYVGFRFPGHLWKLNAPFVWGPIGGLEPTAWRLLPFLDLHGFIHHAGRNILIYLDKKFLGGAKKAFRKASGNLIAATDGIRREIYRWYGQDSVVISEVGPPQEIAHKHSLRASDEPLRLSWSGLHLPGKALPLLFRALAEFRGDIDWHLDILGGGPCTEKWQRLSKKLQIDHRCKWHGQVERSVAIAKMREAHIFVITSLKDLTSTVLLEALSQGVPVVCPDHCGFSNVVDSTCGVKVPVDSQRKLVSGFAVAIQSLAEDEHLRRRLALGAIERVRHFSWESKVVELDRIYRRAVFGSHV